MAERKTEKAKAPKKHKKFRNEKFRTTAIENVCSKDAYTVTLKKKSLILIYIIAKLYAIFIHVKFRLIAPIAPAAFFFKPCDLVFKLNFWRGARRRDGLKKPKILH